MLWTEDNLKKSKDIVVAELLLNSQLFYITLEAALSQQGNTLSHSASRQETSTQLLIETNQKTKKEKAE